MRHPKFLLALVVAALLLVPTLLNAEALPRPLQERIVLETHGGMLQGVLPGCPPCAGLSVVVNAHNYGGAVELFDSETGDVIGEIVKSRHAHLTCAESGQLPDMDTCFQAGLDVLPNTTLDLTIALKGDSRGVGAFINLQATGPTKVTRFGDGDKKTTTSMELDDTILYGETDSGIPVAIRIGRSFGLEPTKGTAVRVSGGPFPDYATMVVKAYAQFTIGWPEEVALAVSSEEGSPEVAVNVLSTDGFDAFEQIDREHLTFGPTGTESVLSNCVSDDVDGDGRSDMSCQISRDVFAERGVQDAVIRGFTVGGDPFEGQTTFSYGTQVATVEK